MKIERHKDAAKRSATKTVLEHTIETFAAHQLYGGELTPKLPPVARDAAQAWIQLQHYTGVKKPQFDETAELDGSRRHVLRNYHDSIVNTLRVFLSHNAHEQGFIIACMQDKIPYRGDDNKTPLKNFDGLTMYQHIAQEHEKYLQDPRGYVKNAAHNARNAIKHRIEK